MAAVASSVAHEVLGCRAVDVDKPIVDYITTSSLTRISALMAMALLRPSAISLLIPAVLKITKKVCSKISEKFGKHGLVKPKKAVRSLETLLRIFDGIYDGEPVKKKVELLDGPVLTERDRVKLERRKQKEERQREAQYQMHLKEMEAVKAGMPVVCVRHDGRQPRIYIWRTSTSPLVAVI